MSRLDGRFLKKMFEQETPTGAVNGLNVTFTLAFTPLENEAVKVYLDGLLLRQGTDYTISGSTITMTTAPALAQQIWAEYIQRTGEN